MFTIKRVHDWRNQHVLSKCANLYNYQNILNNLIKMASSSGVFQGVPDRYNGVTVDSSTEQVQNEGFSSMLEESMKQWTSARKKTIWFKVFLNNAAWIPTLVKNGFVFHHARTDYVTMYKWLSNTPSNIPPYAHTNVGVGAIVTNEKNQLLVVKENYLKYPHWKLPGGYVELEENLADAGMREVLEETSIQTKFQSLIAFRHSHGMNFNCSDFYFIVHLIAESDAIVRNDEIAECQWMDIDVYLTHENVSDMNKLFVQRYLEVKRNQIQIGMSHGIHVLTKREYCLYSMVKVQDETQTT